MTVQQRVSARCEQNPAY